VAPSAVMTEGAAESFGERRWTALEVIRGGHSIRRTLEPADLVGTITSVFKPGPPTKPSR
jgi:hypothetical protein